MKRRDRFEVFRGKDDLWYSRFRVKNGRITRDGGEGYKTKGSASRGIRKSHEREREALASADGIIFVEDGK